MRTDAAVSAKDTIEDPALLAYRFDFNTECVGFLPLDGEQARRVSALKRDYIDPGRALIEVPLADIIEAAGQSPQALTDNPPRFIFHTAFCGSTFLSRCLEVDGITVVLREPQILLDAANAKRLQWQSSTTSLNYRDFPSLALALLRKHAAAQEKLVIKPINSVNNIIPELLEAGRASRSLMLYTDARNFVLSALRKGEGGKQTVRSMFDLIRCDFPQLSNLQLTHTIHMTDLRIAMTLWRLQLEQARVAVKQYSADGVMASLYGDRLIDDPSSVLAAANRFLELGIPTERIDEIARGDTRFRDAKNPEEKFSKQRREERYAQLESYLGDDLSDGLDWMVRNNPGTDLCPDLDGALQR